ncbi:MAG: flagellar basal body rod protein FlgB [Gammaproteobacteria bacterium]|nr:flagellar basal body rod protein FlgB [Gammaproteobacteria bacterium]
MVFSFDKLVGVHEQALSIRAKRNELLASNLANVDTPGYKARDIDFKTALSQANGDQNSGSIKQTHARHLSNSMSGLPNAELLYRVPNQPTLDGNTVDAQVEQAEFGENALRYQASLHFLDRRFKGIISALKGE